MPPTDLLLQHLAIALGLGLLIGLQREKSHSSLAGIRTFPLIAVLGCLCSTFAQAQGVWIFAAGMLAVTALLVAGLSALRHEQSPQVSGMTTALAALVTFMVGALPPAGYAAVAAVVGAGLTILLHLKERLHGWVGALGERDMGLIMRFAAISLVILPVLPDHLYGPAGLEVLNPRTIWLMVVLIVGMSVAGYVALKVWGSRASTILGGVLGGLISSTATTVSWARRAKADPSLSGSATTVVMIASTVAFLRFIAIAMIAAPAHAMALALPLSWMFVAFLALCVLLWATTAKHEATVAAHGNPAELTGALVFAAIFAVVLLAVAWAKIHLGQNGLLVVAAVSGATDMDAITLGTARLVHQGSLGSGLAAKAILVAALSNLVFKAGSVLVLGPRRMFWLVSGMFAIAFAAGVAILLFYPF